MPRLSKYQRERLVQIYEERNLQYAKKRFEKLVEVGKAENIKISELGARNIIGKWQRTGTVADIYSESRILKRMKITEQDADRLDQAIYENRELTAKQVKD